MKSPRRKENIGNSRPTRISFGTTVWCKAILFVLPGNYEIQKVQMTMLHMELGFASELVLDSYKHLVYRQQTFSDPTMFTNTTTLQCQRPQTLMKQLILPPNCGIFLLQLRNLFWCPIEVWTESMSLSLRSKSHI